MALVKLIEGEDRASSSVPKHLIESRCSEENRGDTKATGEKGDYLEDFDEYDDLRTRDLMGYITLKSSDRFLPSFHIIFFVL